MKQLNQALTTLLLASCSLGGVGTSRADILTGPDAELILLILDQGAAKLSYTLDLGLTAKTFWLNAQQDTGASFYTTLSTSSDPAFAAFVAGANPATTRWAVLAFQFTGDAADSALYTTLTNNGVVATQTANYDRIKTASSNTLFDALGAFPDSWVNGVNTADASNSVGSTHATVANGSGLARGNAGDSSYADVNNFFTQSGNNLATGDCLRAAYCIGNPVGTSSWFYRLVPALTATGSILNPKPNLLDEFDNLTADGYWGFAKNTTTGNYLLSYVLAGSNPTSLASTAAGRSRLSFTDYSAQSGSARLIAVAADDVANQGLVVTTLASSVSITAVPEPSTTALWLLGLGGLLAARRRQRSPSAP